MNVILKASVTLAALVAGLSVAIAITGLHGNPITGGLLFIGLSVLMNVVIVVWALQQTAAGNSYGGQLLNGVWIGLIAGSLIFLFSWSLLTVLFPDYLAEMKAGYVEWVESRDLSAPEIERQMSAIDSMTPLSQAIPGFLGTFATSVLAAAMVGAIQRRMAQSSVAPPGPPAES